jgi:hypothetical protein
LRMGFSRSDCMKLLLSRTDGGSGGCPPELA